MYCATQHRTSVSVRRRASVMPVAITGRGSIGPPGSSAPRRQGAARSMSAPPRPGRRGRPPQGAVGAPAPPVALEARDFGLQGLKRGSGHHDGLGHPGQL